MGCKGVNRVVIAVRDIEKGISLYSNLLGTTFEDISWTGNLFGISVAISWEAGIELCAPLPNRDSVVSQFLEQNGEGVMSVVFHVQEIEEAKAQAEGAGIPAIIPINFSQEEIDEHLGGHFTTYKEYVLNSLEPCGFGVMLGQFEPK
jgi:catechol 2,3-dioxygenase-like lactoylglutathione lyase family enzyme